MGKGGIDIIPSNKHSAPTPPPHLAEAHSNSESLARTSNATIKCWLKPNYSLLEGLVKTLEWGLWYHC